jgi:hypothetical protein
MAKKKVILHLKNGLTQNLYPQTDSQYQTLLENLQNGELIHIDTGNGNSKTIRSTNIEWWETENIKETPKERIFTAGGNYFHEKNGKLKFITEEQFNILKKKLYR